MLTHPVEGLVIKTALVDSATVPVDRAGATVVSMVTTCWGARAVASPGVCTGRSEADAEKSCDTDSGCQCRCRYGALESHFLTPFLVDVAVLATCGVTLGRGHGWALWWRCARAVQAITDRQPFAINEIEGVFRPSRKRRVDAAKPVAPAGWARRDRARSRCHRKSNGRAHFRPRSARSPMTPAGGRAWTWLARTTARLH